MNAFALLFVLIAALLLCAVNAVYSPLSSNGTCIPNWTVNWVAGKTVAQFGNYYKGPACGYDVHQPPGSPAIMYQYGGFLAGSTVSSDVYQSSDGFQTFSSTPHTDTTAGVRVYGQVAVLANGNVGHLRPRLPDPAGRALRLWPVVFDGPDRLLIHDLLCLALPAADCQSCAVDISAAQKAKPANAGFCDVTKF